VGEKSSQITRLKEQEGTGETGSFLKARVERIFVMLL
jgi:hypothetical protein